MNMPELPEVQTIVNYLKPKIIGKKILDAESLADRTIRDHKNISEIRKRILGKKIIDVRRVGKQVVLQLSGQEYFLFHLMMTGKLLLNPPASSRHDRFIIFLSGKNKLVFNDIRKFGKCRIINSTDDLTGHDPLKISLKVFLEAIKTKDKVIKIFLLNQRPISGIGNIYADEILWSAGVHPLRRTKSLADMEIKRIYQAMQDILNLSIKKGGTSSRNYRKPDGTEGEYYQIRKAYQRTGEKCARDGAKIQRIIVGGRSTHFCPGHQK